MHDTTLILGEGILNWDRGERQSDRYGYVHLNVDLEGTRRMVCAAPPATLPCHGMILAIITATRQSRHIGDLFRSIFPQTPQVGDRITLGVGTLSLHDDPHYGPRTSIGLIPDDGRATDWMDPHALYRVHEQTVQLVFIPDKRSAS